MLSLFQLNRLFIRPRLGKKPAGRRLFQLIGLFSASLLFSLTLFGGISSAGTKIQEQLQVAVDLIESLNDDTTTDSNSTNLVSSISDGHRVGLVSYNKIQQLLLQRKLTSYRQSQDDLVGRVIKKTSTSNIDADANSSYINTIESLIERTGSRLWQESGRKLTGSAEIQIDLQPDGQLLNLQILTSSGNYLVDKQLLASVRLAAPFPPVPQKLRSTGEESFRLIRQLSFVIEKNGQ